MGNLNGTVPYWADDSQRIYCGDAWDLAGRFEPGSVDIIVTSPPYWGLRSYSTPPAVIGGESSCSHEWGEIEYRQAGGAQPGEKVRWQHTSKGPSGHPKVPSGRGCMKCGAWRGHLGLEPHPQLYIEHLVDLFVRLRPALKPTACLFINMGDSYFSNLSKGGQGPQAKNQKANYGRAGLGPIGEDNWLRPKQLLLIPSRFAIAMQDAGFLLRNDMLWVKRNPLPASVKDRLTGTYEHIFLFVLSADNLYWTHRDTREASEKQPKPDWRWRFEDAPHIETATEIAGWRDVSEVRRALKGKAHAEASVCAADTGWRRVNLWEAQRYYFDLDAVREPHTALGRPPGNRSRLYYDRDPAHAGWAQKMRPEGAHNFAEGGKNPGDCRFVEEELVELGGHEMPASWAGFLAERFGTGDARRWATQPFSGSHFAVFPTVLPSWCLKAGCPREICVRCGRPKVRDVRRARVPDRPGRVQGRKGDTLDEAHGKDGRSGGRFSSVVETIGWLPTCSCGVGFRPGLVLDPFVGSGTTLLAAADLGLRGIGFEFSEEYCAVAADRLKGGSRKEAPRGSA